jgi:hypothetical protein
MILSQLWGKKVDEELCLARNMELLLPAPAVKEGAFCQCNMREACSLHSLHAATQIVMSAYEPQGGQDCEWQKVGTGEGRVNERKAVESNASPQNR